MELRRALTLVMRWWWLLVLAPLLVGILTFSISRQLPPVYRATTTLFVNQTSKPGTVDYSDALLNQQLIKTYSQMAGQPGVLEEVSGILNLRYDLKTLTKMVTIRPIRETQLIEIAVEGNDPAEIRLIADTIAIVFINQQTRSLPSDQATTALRIAQPSIMPYEPISPRVLLNTALAILVGFLVTLGVVALREHLDDTVKTPEDLDAAASLPVLGVIMSQPASKAQQEEKSLAALETRSLVSEAYRLIRTNLEFASVDQPLRTLLVSSASPGEGKSTTASNLAVVLAQAGKRVILMDADLRKPNVHRIFKLSNGHGLTNLLIDAFELTAPPPPTVVYDAYEHPIGLSEPAPTFNPARPGLPRVTVAARFVGLLDSALLGGGPARPAPSVLHPINEYATTGRGMNGYASNGPPTNGHAANGHASNGNGHATNGHAGNGQAHNGFASNGHVEPPVAATPPKPTVSLDEYFRQTEVENLRILPSGPLPPNPAELLASPRLGLLLECLKGHADIIIVDSPPVLAVADPIVLAGIVDGTLMVIDSTRTRAESVRRSTEALSKSGTRLLGAVLNKVKPGKGGYYSSYYMYHSEYAEQPSTPS